MFSPSKVHNLRDCHRSNQFHNIKAISPVSLPKIRIFGRDTREIALIKCTKCMSRRYTKLSMFCCCACFYAINIICVLTETLQSFSTFCHFSFKGGEEGQKQN